MTNDKFVVISQQGDKTTLERYENRQKCGTLQFAFSELESQSANKALVEEYRVYGDKIFDTDPQAA